MAPSRCHGQQRTDWLGPWEKTTKENELQEENDVVCWGNMTKASIWISKRSFHKSWCPYLHPPPLWGARSRGTICLSEPKVLNKRDRAVQECTKCEESAAEWDGDSRRKRGRRGGRGHKESTWWSLYFTPMFVIVCLFFIYHMYVFFYQQRNVWTNRESKVSAWMWWELFTILQWVKAAQLVVVRVVVGEIMIVW